VKIDPTSSSGSALPYSSSRRHSLSRDSGIFGSNARTPRSLLRHALPGLPTSFPTPPTPPTPALSSPSLAAPSPLADYQNISASSFHSPLPQPSRFTRPFTSPSPAIFDNQLPFTPPANAVPIKRGRGRPPGAAAAAAAAAAPSSASKPSSQNICIVGGAAAVASASTPATASKSSRRDLLGALPRHVTKELFISQCPTVASSSSALGELLLRGVGARVAVLPPAAV
jgi:hypothetical protein